MKDSEETKSVFSYLLFFILCNTSKLVLAWLILMDGHFAFSADLRTAKDAQVQVKCHSLKLTRQEQV